MQQVTIIRITAVLGILSVALGAFGAHGLEKLVTPERLETFTTGVRYQFYHTLAIGLAGSLVQSPRLEAVKIGRAVWCWLFGIILFSGSLYLLSLQEVHGLPVSFLGPVTPVGGLFFMVGWGFLFFSSKQ